MTKQERQTYFEVACNILGREDIKKQSGFILALIDRLDQKKGRANLQDLAELERKYPQKSSPKYRSYFDYKGSEVNWKDGGRQKIK